MLSVLYKIGIKSYFKNKTGLFWNFGFVLIWIFIYAYAFPSPDKSDIFAVEASYISFILLFGLSLVSTSVSFYTASSNLSSSYIKRFDNVKKYEIYTGNILSSISFGIAVAIFAIIMSLLIFKLRFGEIKISDIFMLAVTVILAQFFYILFGVIMTYILIIARQVKALRYAGEIPFLLVFVLLLGLQIFKMPSKLLIYISPFNEEFTIVMSSFLGVSNMSYYYNFTFNVYMCLLFLIIWILILAIAAFLLYNICEKSNYRGQYTLEDITK